MRFFRTILLVLFFVSPVLSQERQPIPLGATVIRQGTVDAGWQAALNQGGTIWVQPGDYNLSSNLFLTASANIIGNGAVLHWTNAAALSMTGFAFDTGTNFARPLTIAGLRFDGGIYPNPSYNTTNYFNIQSGFSADPFYNPHWTNRSCMRIEGSGGALIADNYCSGWSGNAIFGIYKGGTLQTQQSQKLRVVRNVCATNFMGIFLPAASYEYPGYYNSSSSLWNDANNAEYSELQQNVCFQNQVGIAAPAGNCLVQNNDSTVNFVNFAMYSGNNSQHGNYSFNNFNHAPFGLWIEGSGNAGVFNGNMFYACDRVNFLSVMSIDFAHNKLGVSALIFTNGCTGWVRDNQFQFNAVWGTGILTNFSGSPALIVTGNISEDGTNSDGSIQSLSAIAGSYADSTNYVAARFSPPPAGQFKLVPSNSWMWGVTATTTNRLYQFGP